MLIDKIRELCRQRNITLQQLEKDSNIANGTIARWAKSSPKIETLVKVADTLNVSIDYLVERAPVSYDVVPSDILELVNTIQALPPELRILIEHQLKVFANINSDPASSKTAD